MGKISQFSEGKQKQLKYIDDYNKKNYSMFSAQLKKEEYTELKELLKNKKMSNAEFVRWATEKLRSM